VRIPSFPAVRKTTARIAGGLRARVEGVGMLRRVVQQSAALVIRQVTLSTRDLACLSWAR